jgi:hypothetical protein
MLEAAGKSETSIHFYQTINLQVLKSSHIYGHRFANLKSHASDYFSTQSLKNLKSPMEREESTDWILNITAIEEY